MSNYARLDNHRHLQKLVDMINEPMAPEDKAQDILMNPALTDAQLADLDNRVSAVPFHVIVCYLNDEDGDFILEDYRWLLEEMEDIVNYGRQG